METNDAKMAELEALLFHYGEPIEMKKITKFLGISKSECEALLTRFEEDLNNSPARGLALLRKGEEVQLATKPSVQKLIQELVQEEFKENLSPASLETLAIIAYLGPVPRSSIDYIRGVNSSFILRNLLIRGLVSRNFHPERKNVYVYEASFDFLKHLGLAKPENLPEYEKYKNILINFESQEPSQAL